MLDKLTKRLHAFEASAQNMAMSYRPIRPNSPTSAMSKAPAETLGKKQAEMEEEFTAMRQHVEKLERDNKKMQKTLEKYRQKWETLKAGAKARREAQSGGDSVEDARNV
jgi:predicted RNase H-like nuclease (RuvC/YqgF family)